MYSDPEMFFDIWCKDALKSAKKMRQQREERNKRKSKGQSQGQVKSRKDFQPVHIKTKREEIAEREAMAGNVTLKKKKDKVNKEQEKKIPPVDYDNNGQYI